MPGRIRFSLEPQHQGLGFFEPFEFFAESRLQPEEQNLVARSLRGAPTPTGMIVKFFFSHGIPFLIFQSASGP